VIRDYQSGISDDKRQLDDSWPAKLATDEAIEAPEIHPMTPECSHGFQVSYPIQFVGGTFGYKSSPVSGQ